LQKIDALTGLRFIAALEIVLTHSQVPYLLGVGTLSAFNLKSGVAIFFTLSGFVLAMNLERYRGNWRGFIVARFARIWPAHAAAVAFLFAIFWPYSPSLVATGVGRAQLAANLSLLQAWSPTPGTYYSLNAPSWSISCEMFFYLAFPLLACTILRWPWRSLPVVVAAGVAFVRVAWWIEPGIDQVWLYYINPVINLTYFAIGIAAGLWFSRARASPAGYACGTFVQCAAIVAIGAVNTMPLRHQLPFGLEPFVEQWMQPAFALCYAALLISLARYDGAASRFLASRPCVYLGEVSYSLYLFHQLVIRWYSGKLDAFSGLPWWAQWGGVCSASLLIAMISYHVVERPARRWIVLIWGRARPAPQAVGRLRSTSL
jgi:peptidoglycan/LPS O-acetylase OafA/YrhL